MSFIGGGTVNKHDASVRTLDLTSRFGMAFAQQLERN